MDVLQQLRWVVALASLVACSAVTYNRNALYFGSNLPLQQQYHPVLYSQQAYTPQAYSPQAYQPLNVRSGASQNYHPQQQYVQQQYVQQQHIPLQSQHQRVLLYNPASGQYSQQAFPAGAYPMPQGAVFPYPPLRAQGEGGSGGGSGSGGGWGFNPSEYLTILQNYWQSFSGSTQSGKPPSEPAPSGAEAPTPVSPDGTDSSNNAAAAMASPGGAQRFFVVSQPVAPVALPSASNGAVSTYLLLQNQPVYSSWLGQQDNSVRVQPINTMQPIHSTQADRPQQPILPSSGDPLILVRTADSKYGLAPANQPSRVLVSGEGVRGQDDVKVSGPDSHALAFQQFLLKRQGGDLTHYTPGFYPAPHPSVVHSLTDESISVEALRDSANSSEPETSTAAITSTSPTPPSSSNKDEEEVIDVDGEKPVSIAQVKPQAIALAGPGGVAAAAPVGTALVGPGGMALSAPSATAVAGPQGTSSIAVPSANTATHNADAYRKWLGKKKPANANDDVADAAPEFLIEYGPSVV